MFKRLKIRTKILLAFAVIAIITVLTIALVSFTIGQTTLERESFNKLTAVREMKANQIEDYFQLIADQIVTQSEDRMIVEAMRDFDQGYQAIESEIPLSVGMLPALGELYRDEFLERLVPNLLREVTVEEYLPRNNKATILQDLYIASNPFETGSKHLLDAAGDGSSYSAAHELYHPIIRDFLEHFGYHDIFLVNPEGDIVYSVFKEVDFGTSLTEGPYSETNFARAFRTAFDAEETEVVIVEDFEPYHPSYNAPAAFMASPIFDSGEKIGVLVYQMPIDRINDIMTNDQKWSKVGLGDSGETYLVGPDFLLRNQSRFLIEDSDNYFRALDESGVPLATMGQIRNLNSTVGLQEVDTPGTRAALSGETGTDVFPDYRNVDVLSAFKPLAIAGLEWAIMSEIDEAEAFASIQALGLRLVIASIALIAFIAVAAYYFSRMLTRPLVELTNDAEQLSYGVLDLEIGNMDSKDEIGDLARNFDVMRLSLKKLIDDLALLNKDLENKVIERTAELEASERQSNAIIELSSDAIIVIDENAHVLVWNARAEELFGHTREDMSRNPLNLIIPDSFGGQHEHAFAQAIKNRELKSPGVTNELSALNKDGREFPIELSLSHWEIGGKSYFSASLRDITERKRMEAEIADQLAFTRNVLDTIPNPVFVKDSDQRYIMFNQTYEETFGLVGRDLIGKTVMDFELLALEDRKFYCQKDTVILKTGEPYRDEAEVQFADGEMHSVLQWLTPYKLADGTIGGIVGVTADITDIKELERQLEIANERMSTELNFARDIQISMLPLIFPAFPERKEVTVHAALDSAREVGGDFYDFYFLDDDHLCFVVGDVSGKGAPGALMMAVSKTLIKSRAADDNEPASILTHVNDELSQDNVSSMFVTVFLGIMNVKTGEFVYTNAGHNPPYIRRKDGSIQKIDAFHGPVIGAMPGMPYDQDYERLYEGDVILVYSDGVTEAFSEEDELFSEERLEQLLQNKSITSDKDVVEATQRALTQFVGRAEQSDDITLLAVQYLLHPDAEGSVDFNITIKNRYEDMAIVESGFSQFAAENNLSDPVRQSMSIVLDEMLNNVISYAYQGKKEKEIEVDFELSGNRLVLTIKDSGVPFNPFARKSPDITEGIEDRQLGGLGIHMVRNMMDEYSYQRQINKNVVTLVKLIEYKSV